MAFVSKVLIEEKIIYSKNFGNRIRVTLKMLIPIVTKVYIINYFLTNDCKIPQIRIL